MFFPVGIEYSPYYNLTLRVWQRRESSLRHSHCRPFTPDARSHKQEPGETLGTDTRTRTPPHNSAERSICPNKQHMLFVFYNKHRDTESSGNTNTARSPAPMTEEGEKKKEEATSSVRDVRDKSQIRSESEFPLRSRPVNPQLGPCRHMTHVFRGREDADAAKAVRLLFFSLASATVCSRLKSKRRSGGKIFSVSSGPNIPGVVRPLVPD